MASPLLIEEDHSYLRLRQWRDKVLRPFCAWLQKYPVKPEHLTYIGLFMMVPFVYFFHFNPWISLVFLVLNQVLDGIDGVFARFTGKATAKGEFLDHGLDYLAFFIVFFTLQYYQFFDSFWAGLYLANYIIMVSLEVIAKQSNIKTFPTIKTKYGAYLLLFIWLISGANFFNPCIVLATVYMMVTNMFLFHHIRWGLS